VELLVIRLEISHDKDKRKEKFPKQLYVGKEPDDGAMQNL
jgi:hypothetical protein